MKVVIIGAGGTGLNIVRNIDLNSFKNRDYYPEVKKILLDASIANLRDRHIETLDVKLIPGMEGAGKSRKYMAKEALNKIKEIISDLNLSNEDLVLLVFSLSGGSGSVIGPAIISHLVKQEIPNISFTVASTQSIVETQNAIKTLEGLYNLSYKIKKPITIRVFGNYHKEGDREVYSEEKTNLKISNYILKAVRIGAKNLQQDKRDIINFFFWNNVLDPSVFEPTLMEIYLAESKEEALKIAQNEEKNNDIYTLMSLVREDGDVLELFVPYQTQGVYPKSYIMEENPSSIYFLTSPTELIKYLNSLKEAEREMLNTIQKVEDRIEITGEEIDDGIIV